MAKSSQVWEHQVTSNAETALSDLDNYELPFPAEDSEVHVQLISYTVNAFFCIWHTQAFSFWSPTAILNLTILDVKWLVIREMAQLCFSKKHMWSDP